jgi:hypothetical protein
MTMLATIYCLYFTYSLGTHAYHGKPGWWKRFGMLFLGAVLLAATGALLQDARANSEAVLAAGLAAGVGFAALVGVSSGLAWLLKPKNKMTAP